MQALLIMQLFFRPYLESCDTMDTMPLTPASFAGLDHKVSRRDLIPGRVHKVNCSQDPVDKMLLAFASFA
jgi:hypothetical protein